MSGLSNIQTQVQTQGQVQTLSPQQVLEARLLELNTLELEEHVRTELNDNPTLESGPQDAPEQENQDDANDDANQYDNESYDDSRDDWNDDDDDWYAGKVEHRIP